MSAKKERSEASKDAKSAEKMKQTMKEMSEEARILAERAKEKAKEIAGNLDESTKEFQEEAKSTAADFKEGAREAYDDLTSKKENKRLLAGIMALLFGGLGIHKFLLGYNKEGFIMLALSIISFGYLFPVMVLVGWIEGIIYLTRSDLEFYRTYQLQKKAWF